MQTHSNPSTTQIFSLGVSSFDPPKYPWDVQKIADSSCQLSAPQKITMATTPELKMEEVEGGDWRCGLDGGCWMSLKKIPEDG